MHAKNLPGKWIVSFSFLFLIGLATVGSLAIYGGVNVPGMSTQDSNRPAVDRTSKPEMPASDKADITPPDLTVEDALEHERDKLFDLTDPNNNVPVIKAPDGPVKIKPEE